MKGDDVELLKAFLKERSVPEKEAGGRGLIAGESALTAQGAGIVAIVAEDGGGWQ